MSLYFVNRYLIQFGKAKTKTKENKTKNNPILNPIRQKRMVLWNLIHIKGKAEVMGYPGTIIQNVTPLLTE